MKKDTLDEYTDYLSSLTKDEAMMFCLRMGYVIGKNETLKTEKQRVIEITSNAIKYAFEELKKSKQ